MTGRKYTIAVLISILAVGASIIGCDDDTNYDQRTVVYVSNINDGAPYFSDVINQGDSLWNDTRTDYLYSDDFIEEDWVKVQFHNRPYSGIVSPCASALCDFLVTGYDVSFTRLDGGTVPVPSFSGKTSILVPASSFVEGFILLVPFYAKNEVPLDGVKYGVTEDEIMAQAYITFYGHEIQTERNIDFSCGLTVNFADDFDEEEND
jgi:hypothetical protein